MRHLQRLGVRSMTLAAMAVVVSSCTPSRVSTTTPATTGGTAVIGVWENSPNAMSGTITGSLAVGVALEGIATEGLVAIRDVDEQSVAKVIPDVYEPQLATTVPTIDNHLVQMAGPNCSGAMCVTYPLRHNVYWHDGNLLTASDVCATYQFWWGKWGNNNPTLQQPGAQSPQGNGWNDISQCTVVSPFMVTLVYGTIYAPYLAQFQAPYGILESSCLQPAFTANGGHGGSVETVKQTIDLTKGSGNSAAFSGTDTMDHLFCGTGPYVFSKWDTSNGQTTVTFVANKRYWNHSDPPKLDSIVWRSYADEPSLLAAVQSGAVTLAYDLRQYEIPTLQTIAASTHSAIQITPADGAELLDLNVCGQFKKCGTSSYSNPFLADPAVRKAILYAVDRQSIVNQFAPGTTILPDGWGAGIAAFDDDPLNNPTTTFRTDAAKSILDQGGYVISPKCGGMRTMPNGSCIVPLRIGTTGGAAVREGEEKVIAQDLQNVGIPVATSFENVPGSGFFGVVWGKYQNLYHNFDIALFAESFSFPRDADTFFSAYRSDQIYSAANPNAGNDTGVADPVIDAALLAGRSTLDPTARNHAYQQLFDQLANDDVELPLYQQKLVNSVGSRLQGVGRYDIVWTGGIADWSCTGGRC